jgi:hypothetical protein
LVFEPTGATPESLFGNYEALRLPINIEIGRRRPLTTRMWENLFREMEDAALSTDLRLYEEALASFNVRDGGEGFQFIIRQTDRFVVTSIDRGSIEITGAVLLAAGWIYKKFIEPGWEKSESKKAVPRQRPCALMELHPDTAIYAEKVKDCAFPRYQRWCR